jgi:uracil phosphoribosyltransferase
LRNYGVWNEKNCIIKRSIFKPIKKTTEISDQLVISSVLRAGLPYIWVLNYFDQAENGFVSAFRYHPNNDDYFEIKVDYQAIADFNNKYLLIVDPMLATGQSIVAVLTN